MVTRSSILTLESKRCLLFGSKTMKNLDSILKRRDITLPTKVHIVKAMVFPLPTYKCKSCTIRNLSTKELMLLNCGAGEDSWESLGQQDQTAAAAKSLQSCPTLYDPIDGSPPGSPVPGILQARILEWVAISLSKAWKWKVKSESEVAQSCPTLHDPMDYSLPGSSVHGIFQAKVLEWGAITFSKDQTS